MFPSLCPFFSLPYFGFVWSFLSSLVAKSFAGIQVSRVDRHSVATGERLVTVTGNFEVQLKAIELILEELCKDLKYQPNLTSPFPYGGIPLNLSQLDVTTLCYYLMHLSLFDATTRWSTMHHWCCGRKDRLSSWIRWKYPKWNYEGIIM